MFIIDIYCCSNSHKLRISRVLSDYNLTAQIEDQTLLIEHSLVLFLCSVVITQMLPAVSNP